MKFKTRQMLHRTPGQPFMQTARASLFLQLTGRIPHLRRAPACFSPFLQLRGNRSRQINLTFPGHPPKGIAGSAPASGSRLWDQPIAVGFCVLAGLSRFSEKRTSGKPPSKAFDDLLNELDRVSPRGCSFSSPFGAFTGLWVTFKLGWTSAAKQLRSRNWEVTLVALEH